MRSLSKTLVEFMSESEDMKMENNDYVRALLDARKERKTFREFHKKHRELFTRLAADLAKFQPNFSPSPSYLYLTIQGDVHTLTAVLRVMYRHGLKTKEKPAEKKPTYSAWFSLGDELVLILNFTSTVCRRVKIGTKTVEQDVYEIVCGEIEPHGEQSAA